MHLPPGKTGLLAQQCARSGAAVTVTCVIAVKDLATQLLVRLASQVPLSYQTGLRHASYGAASWRSAADTRDLPPACTPTRHGRLRGLPSDEATSCWIPSAEPETVSADHSTRD